MAAKFADQEKQKNGQAVADLHLTDEALPSRRTFLQGMVRAALAAEVALVALPAAEAFRLLPDAPEPKATEARAKFKGYPCTNAQLTLANGQAVHNLGVYHTEDWYQCDKDLIDKAIFDADIICVECTQGEGNNGYFLDRAKYAHSLNKKVIDIDCFDKETALSSKLGLMTASVISGVGLGLKLNGEIMPEGPQGALLTTALRAAGYYSVLASYPSIPNRLHTVSGYEAFLGADFSYISDARTIFMLSHLTHVSTMYPNRKILVITGDGHASRFNYYLDDPIGKAIFGKKLALYTSIFQAVSPHTFKELTT